LKQRSAVLIVSALSLFCLSGISARSAFAQTPAPPPETADSATTPQTSSAADALAIPAITYPTRLFSGFGDIVFTTAKSGTARNFSLGQLTLQYTSALSPRTFVFSEVTFSPRNDAGTGNPPASGFNAEVERLFLRYDFNDSLKVSAGRYHTPINWWNTAFHHGLWLQTTIARPEMIRFGGQFLPPHFTGALVEGALPTSGLNLYYNLGVGNGRASVTGRSGDAGDINGATAQLLNLYVRPDNLYGLQVGGSVYLDHATVNQGNTGATASVRETIIAGHIVYQKENPEVIAEYAHTRHKQEGGPSNSNHAYYVQVAYRRPGSLFKPYYRYERVHVSANDPILTSTPSLTGHTFGTRYDFTELAAFKLEYRDMERSPRGQSYAGSTTGLFAQVSFAF
jgi:hypothetical protein